MRKIVMCFAVMALLGAGTLFAQDAHDKAAKEKPKKSEKAGKQHQEMPANPVNKAICVLSSTEGNTASGWVKFTKGEEGVLIEAEVKGLTPNSKHGFHIHEFGDISGADGMATGGHFNPGGHDHGSPEANTRHVGDFGNIEADADGVGHYKRVDKKIRLQGRDSIVGRGIIVHAGEDDLTTQPTGNAGARIAQGVIGVAKAE